MNYIKLYSEEYDPGVTLVSNVFIDYFLKDANDAQLKIYLYLVRHISSHKPFTISSIADEFNHTEKDVVRALSYWEQKQVLSLECDASGDIIGIELHELNESMLKPEPELQHFPVLTLAGEPKKANNESAKSNVFSSSDFVEMSKEQDWISIKSIAENYLGRSLSGTDLQSLAHIYKELRFSPSEVDKLFEECLSSDKKTMRSIKKFADERFLQKNISPSTVAVMKALGEDSAPTSDELSYIDKWLDEMSLELVLEGCKKATLATNTNRFKYAEGIFRNWRAQNIKSIEDMAASEELFKKNKDSSKKQTSVKDTVNKFKQYRQTQYDFAALEREVGIN